jgi:hypothetical protein
MSDIVYESPDKDGFSTSDRSGNHTGKRMDPWHEMTRIVFIGDVKCVRIVGLMCGMQIYNATKRQTRQQKSILKQQQPYTFTPEQQQQQGR